MLYFAYGSNMCTGRLRDPQRIPSAEPVCVATLAKHALRFHKLSKKDGSAKADAFYTGDSNDVIWGVIFEIDPAEKPKLDKAEGLGHGYTEKQITATDTEGKQRVVLMYVTEPSYIRSGLLPYSWYKRFVVEGAKLHKLPADYVEQIEAVPHSEDPDLERDAENRRINCEAR